MPNSEETRRQCGFAKDIVQWAQADGMPLTEYSLRLLIRQGKIPVRNIGKKRLIFYPNVVSYLRCETGSDNFRPSEQKNGVRRIEI